MLGERRRRLEVAQRRHGAQARAGACRRRRAAPRARWAGRRRGPGCGRTRRPAGRRPTATGRGTSRPARAPRQRHLGARTSARLSARPAAARSMPAAGRGADGRSTAAPVASGEHYQRRRLLHPSAEVRHELQMAARRASRCSRGVRERRRPGRLARPDVEQEAFDDETSICSCATARGAAPPCWPGRAVLAADDAAVHRRARPDRERGRDLRGEPQLRQSLRQLPGRQRPARARRRPDAPQLDRDGTPLKELPPIWDGLTAKGVTPPVTQAADRASAERALRDRRPEGLQPAARRRSRTISGTASTRTRCRSTAARTTCSPPRPIPARW